MSIKKEFIRQTAISNSLISSFQRANVYANKKLKDTVRIPLKDALAQRLRQMENLLRILTKVNTCSHPKVNGIRSVATLFF